MLRPSNTHISLKANAPYNDLIRVGKRVSQTSKAFFLSQRHEGGGEVRSGRAAGQHAAQGRSDLAETHAFGFCESADQYFQRRDRPVVASLSREDSRFSRSKVSLLAS